MSGSGRSGTGHRVYRRNRDTLLAASDICAICGHGGARTADHIISAPFWPRDENGRMLPGFNDLTNLQPAHGTMGAGRATEHNRCPVCHRLCNQSKGSGPSRRPSSRDWFPNGIPGA